MTGGLEYATAQAWIYCRAGAVSSLHLEVLAPGLRTSNLARVTAERIVLGDLAVAVELTSPRAEVGLAGLELKLVRRERAISIRE